MQHTIKQNNTGKKTSACCRRPSTQEAEQRAVMQDGQQGQQEATRSAGKRRRAQRSQTANSSLTVSQSGARSLTATDRQPDSQARALTNSKTTS
jgi:hypothetical protein